MPELTEYELLDDFARDGSEEAFATLVARYVNLVYSTAVRFTGNAHHAEEITQAVFIILAHKAGKLSPKVVLSGWLYQATRLTAANFMKAEIPAATARAGGLHAIHLKRSQFRRVATNCAIARRRHGAPR